LPDAVPPTFYEGSSSGVWSVDVEYNWLESGRGTFAAFITDPLPAHAVVAGSGSVDLWIKSNLGDTDLEVTISEVRPDGQEMYVQSGWLRASQAALDNEASTALRPVHTHRLADAAVLPPDEFVLVRVELFPFAHAFRAGSQIRLMIDAPGGNRAVWEFETIAGGEKVTIATGVATPSRLALPVIPGIAVPDEYPECGALRGQPCRIYSGF
jgi:predicted acyl esterase